MRHVRDVIRLKSAGMSTREIARRMGTAPSTVRLTIRRFEAAGLTFAYPHQVAVESRPWTPPDRARQDQELKELRPPSDDAQPKPADHEDRASGSASEAR